MQRYGDGMKGKFVVLSGTASRACPAERLDLAIRFVQLFVAEVLKAGGGMVVLLGGENRTEDADGRPRIFDWIVLRAIEDYVAVTTQAPRTYARAVMSDHTWQSRLDDGNRQTLTNLQQRRVLEVERIKREEFTGGKYRAIQCELADGMIALGGGKGTYAVGRKMIASGKPVLPLDLDIGAFSEDGEGALLLHRELQSDPGVFLPVTHGQVVNQIEALSLAGCNSEVRTVAQRAVEVLSLELASSGSGKIHGIRRLAGYVKNALVRFLTAINVLRAIDFLKQLLAGG